MSQLFPEAVPGIDSTIGTRELTLTEAALVLLPGEPVEGPVRVGFDEEPACA